MKKTEPLRFSAKCLDRQAANAAPTLTAFHVHGVFSDGVVAQPRAIAVRAGPRDDLAVSFDDDG